MTPTSRVPSAAAALLCAACSGAPSSVATLSGGDIDDSGIFDSGIFDSGSPDTGEPVDSGPDPFADRVASFSPGTGAGFGQESYPDVVLGWPEGGGEVGSLDVMSLGEAGEIVLEFDDMGVVDGEGADLLVFENPFPGWYELATVAVSDDGETWHEWPCDVDDEQGGYPGCAGVGLVEANSDNDVDATDPETAGGDAFDLAMLADFTGKTARYVRIRDTGTNSYDGTAGGFDLDAVAVVNGQSLTD